MCFIKLGTGYWGVAIEWLAGTLPTGIELPDPEADHLSTCGDMYRNV